MTHSFKVIHVFKPVLRSSLRVNTAMVTRIELKLIVDPVWLDQIAEKATALNASSTTTLLLVVLGTASAAKIVSTTTGNSWATHHTIEHLHFWVSSQFSFLRRVQMLLFGLLKSICWVERTPYDLVIVNIASALGPGLLDLVFKHRINRVCRVKGRFLRDKIYFISLELMQRLNTPLLYQILEDASTG